MPIELQAFLFFPVVCSVVFVVHAIGNLATAMTALGKALAVEASARREAAAAMRDSTSERYERRMDALRARTYSRDYDLLEGLGCRINSVACDSITLTGALTGEQVSAGLRWPCEPMLADGEGPMPPPGDYGDIRVAPRGHESGT